MIAVARGGRRQGTPGKAYGNNRTDLQTNYAPISAPQPAPPAGVGAAPQAGTPQIVAPTQTAAQPAVPQPLNTFAPTAYPHLPITHGLPSGPGAGPEVLAPPPFQPDPLAQATAAIQAVPAVHQTPMMRALAASLSASVGNASGPGVAPGAS